MTQTKAALAHCTSYNVLKFTSFTAITCASCISLSPISAVQIHVFVYFISTFGRLIVDCIM